MHVINVNIVLVWAFDVHCFLYSYMTQLRYGGYLFRADYRGGNSAKIATYTRYTGLDVIAKPPGLITIRLAG